MVKIVILLNKLHRVAKASGNDQYQLNKRRDARTPIGLEARMSSMKIQKPDLDSQDKTVKHMSMTATAKFDSIDPDLVPTLNKQNKADQDDPLNQKSNDAVPKIITKKVESMPNEKKSSMKIKKKSRLSKAKNDQVQTLNVDDVTPVKMKDKSNKSDTKESKSRHKHGRKSRGSSNKHKDDNVSRNKDESTIELKEDNDNQAIESNRIDKISSKHSVDRSALQSRNRDKQDHFMETINQVEQNEAVIGQTKDNQEDIESGGDASPAFTRHPEINNDESDKLKDEKTPASKRLSKIRNKQESLQLETEKRSSKNQVVEKVKTLPEAKTPARLPEETETGIIQKIENQDSEADVAKSQISKKVSNVVSANDERDISPDDISNNKSLNESSQSRNRAVVTPSQKSTRMITKQSRGSEGKPAAFESQKDEIIEENEPKSIHEEEKKSRNDIQQNDDEDIKQEDDDLPSHHSDHDIISELSKPKSNKKSRSSRRTKNTIEQKPQTINADEDQEVVEPTEIDKTSVKFEESEGDAEGDSENEESEIDQEGMSEESESDEELVEDNKKVIVLNYHNFLCRVNQRRIRLILNYLKRNFKVTSTELENSEMIKLQVNLTHKIIFVFRYQQTN